MASAWAVMAVVALATAGCTGAPATVAAVGEGCTQDWPAGGTRVVDAADVLSADAEARLTSALAGIEARTAHQMVVATVPTLQGRPIEAYSLCLANHWGIGRKGVDDGVLLLVAPVERKVRIEVGRGLEAALTNDEAKAIVDRAMLPPFARGDYAGGVGAGVAAVSDEIS
jgi:uncharacterized protein